MLAWYVFHSLLYNLFVSFNLKCISYRKHIFGSCFFINSSSLYFLIGAFMPFIFSVIIGTIRFKSITFKFVYKYHFDSSFLLSLYVFFTRFGLIEHFYDSIISFVDLILLFSCLLYCASYIF